MLEQLCLIKFNSLPARERFPITLIRYYFWNNSWKILVLQSPRYAFIGIFISPGTIWFSFEFSIRVRYLSVVKFAITTWATFIAIPQCVFLSPLITSSRKPNMITLYAVITKSKCLAFIRAFMTSAWPLWVESPWNLTFPCFSIRWKSL